jgi:hypothetical protein
LTFAVTGSFDGSFATSASTYWSANPIRHCRSHVPCASVVAAVVPTIIAAAVIAMVNRIVWSPRNRES